jgi:MFS family permease
VRRYLALLADAGWRIAFHIGPYALTAGVAAELAGRLRAPFLWKLPVFAVVVVLLLIGVLLGTHVAIGRRNLKAARETVPLRTHLAAAPRIMRETMVLLALMTVVALAAVGMIDLVLLVVEPAAGESWPWTALRLIATAAAVCVSLILLTAAMALAASGPKGSISLDTSLLRLHRQAPAAFGVISFMIAVGTAAAVLGFQLAPRVGVWPPVLADALAKGLGFLAASTVLTVGAALLTADE